MLLVIDVGNTNIVLGVYDKKNLVGHWRISTDRVRTTDEYGMLMMNLFFHDRKVDVKDIKDIIDQNINYYNIGLQGPDILFFYRPLKKTSVSALGSKLHEDIAREFSAINPFLLNHCA